jgi:hypothetical protein
MTATLPKKYYDLEGHERRMRSIANGETVAAEDDDLYDFRKDEADMKSRYTQSKKPTRGMDEELSQKALMDLRRIENERIQMSQMKRMGLQTKASLGVSMVQLLQLCDKLIFFFRCGTSSNGSTLQQKKPKHALSRYASCYRISSRVSGLLNVSPGHRRSPAWHIIATIRRSVVGLDPPPVVWAIQ